MFKTNIKTLFRDVRSIPLESGNPDLVAHISFGYRNLLILAYTMPWVTETLGNQAQPQALTARLLEASQMLAADLDKDMTAEDRTRCILYLLHSLCFHYNPEHMLVAQNAVTEILDSVDSNKFLQLKDSPYICKILCYDYYFRTDKKSCKKAEKMLTQWKEQQQQDGSWNVITLDYALQRLESYALYSDVVDRNKFEKTIRKSLHYYADLPQINNEVRFLFLLAQMGIFSNYPEQVEQIINNLLQGKVSETPTGSIPDVNISDVNISDVNRTKDPNMLTALRFHILALYLLNTEQE